MSVQPGSITGLPWLTSGLSWTIRRADRMLAEQLYQRGLSLQVIENALVLAATRMQPAGLSAGRSHCTTASTTTQPSAIASNLRQRWRAVAAHADAELDAVLGDRLPAAGDLASLPYTRKVLTESMRLYPPAWAIA